MKKRTGEPWVPPAVYGRTLTGLTLNLIVRDIDRSVPFYRDVLGLEVLYHDPDFAAVAGSGAKITLHADHTYEAMPLWADLGDATPRGRGAEIRVLGIDPDRVMQAAAAHGAPVLVPPRTYGHGWRAVHVSDPDGYVFAVGVLTDP